MIRFLITPAEVLQLAFSTRDQLSAGAIRYPKIMIAQERYIVPALGQELCERLYSTPAYQLFLEDYIRPALAYFVRHGIIEELAFEISDAGVGQPTREQTSRTHEASQTDNLTRNATQATEESARRELANVQGYQEVVITMGDNHQNDTTTEEKRSAEDNNTSSLRTTLRAATDAQCQMLAARALRDARILLQRAISYIEQYPDQFPDYAPAPSSF